MIIPQALRHVRLGDGGAARGGGGGGGGNRGDERMDGRTDGQTDEDQGGGGDLYDRTQLHAESLMERFEPGISRMPRKAIAT